MSNDQMTIEPENPDFYRPTGRRGPGGLPRLLIKLSGGRISEEGANRILLAFAIVVFIISAIILMTAI